MNASTMSSLLVLLLLVAGRQYLVNAMEACNTNLFRLPLRVQPSDYKLNLRLDPKDEFFKGSVVIDLNIIYTRESYTFLSLRSIDALVFPLAVDPKNIILNAESLDVDTDNVEFHQGGHKLDATTCADTENNILVVRLKEEPSIGKATLSLSFKGEVQKEAKGLFRSYVGSSQALVTQLESNYARRLFPCFDEPEFKATFLLSIVHPEGTTALSNTPIIKEGNAEPDYKMTTYERTPKMPSYMFGLAVGEFKRIKGAKQEKGPKISMYVPENWKSVSTMLEMAGQAYKKVEEFFNGYPQPLKKIDIVAVNMGPYAMENLGLITMRMDLLSASPTLTPPNEWNRAVFVLMSQMVHQRLACLATINWWDDLWFIKGLANHLARKLTAELYPQICDELYTLFDTTISVMMDEDNRKSHPIKNKNHETAREIEKSFDLFSYKKSEVVLRMIFSFLGEDTFTPPIHDLILCTMVGYEKAMSDENWWGKLSCNFPHYRKMADIIKHWTENDGHPTIIVSLTDKKTLLVKQVPGLAGGQVWSVPIKYEVYSGPENTMIYSSEFILPDSKEIEIPILTDITLWNENTWLKLNPGYQGCYRVVYESPSMHQALMREATAKRMPEADRMQIISDLFVHYKHPIQIRNMFIDFRGESEDGMVLLLTKLFTELDARNLELSLEPLIYTLLHTYHYWSGGVLRRVGSNVLRESARSSVLDYLVNKLNCPRAIDSVRKFMRLNRGKLPLFLKHVPTG